MVGLAPRRAHGASYGTLGRVEGVRTQPAAMTATDRDTLPEPVIERLRRERREPRPTQFDYLHLTVLRAHLRAAIEEAPRPILDALDVFCGVRPYDDLLPARTRIVGLDIDAHFGEPDVTGDTLGAFDDQSFDLVMCLEALHYAPDPLRRSPTC